MFNESNRRGYINGLLDAIIKNDIAKRFKVRNVEALRRIAAYLADNYCQEFVAKTVGELFEYQIIRLRTIIPTLKRLFYW